MPNERFEDQKPLVQNDSERHSNTAAILLDTWGPRSGALQESPQQQRKEDVAGPASMASDTAHDISQDKIRSTESIGATQSPSQQQEKVSPAAGKPSDSTKGDADPQVIDWSKVPNIYMSF